MYQFYLGKILLPIAPESNQMNIEDKDQTIDLANGATMTILNLPGLTTWKFEFRVPSRPYPFAVYQSGFMSPGAFFQHLEELKKSQKPFQFKIIRGSTFVDGRDTDAIVSLVNYDISEDAEEYGMDFIVNVELMEYVPHKTLVGTIKNDEFIVSEDKILVDDSEERDEIEYTEQQVMGGGTYQIKVGDTYQSISQNFFEGSMNYAEAIAEYNDNYPPFSTDLLDQYAGYYIYMHIENIKELAKKMDGEKVEEQKKLGIWDYVGLAPSMLGAAIGNAIDKVVGVFPKW